MSSSTPPRPPQGPHLIQWILDTRPLWPEATKTKDLEQAAPRALALLTPDERAAVLRFYHLRDAKLALASHLLKRHAVVRFCGVPWARAGPIRDHPAAKPTWRDAAGDEPLRFNVSHQAGLVAMLAVHGYPGPGGADVGVDVVCTSERRVRDRAMIAAEGWPHFVDVHADVLSPREVAFLKFGVLEPVHDLPGRPAAGAGADEVADFRLRCFYALWCLREAYVKMTGEALLAPWLRDLEFRAFRAPEPAAGVEGGSLAVDEAAAAGTAVRQHDVFFEGRRVDDANVCLRSLGPDYMVCAAVRTPERKEDGLGFRLGGFEMVSMEEVIASGEAAT